MNNYSLKAPKSYKKSYEFAKFFEFPPCFSVVGIGVAKIVVPIHFFPSLRLLKKKMILHVKTFITALSTLPLVTRGKTMFRKKRHFFRN